MRLLFLSYWYHPEPVTKPHDFAREMVRRGHRVTAITGFPNYPAGKLYPGYRMRVRHREVIDGVDVVRVPMILDRSRSGLRRVLSYASFAVAATLSGPALRIRPDVIWNYQIGLPGVALGRLLGAPVVHEVQDLWPEWGQSSGMRMGGALYRALDAQERMIYRQAAAVTTISDGFRERLVEKGLSESKITLIPNWANGQNFHPKERNAFKAMEEGLPGGFSVVYGGNVGAAQGLGVVLDAADLLRRDAGIQFTIVGDGVERKSLERRAAERGLSNVWFLGRRPPEEMAGYLSCADALLIHVKESPDYAITIPSKTYSYLAMGKPIIAAASGEVATLVQELEAGIVCPPDSPSALADAVRKLRSQPGADRERMGQRGREAFLARFACAVLADRYERLFEQVATVSSRSRGPSG